MVQVWWEIGKKLQINHGQQNISPPWANPSEQVMLARLLTQSKKQSAAEFNEILSM